MICRLALEDGTVFEGLHFGAPGTATGEVVFNTGMTGYQEIITDPSYHGQIVTMTAPMIGNYGINAEDAESARPSLSGFVVRELAGLHSNHRATGDLAAFCKQHDIIGIAGVDTRAITLALRETGALRGAISTELGETNTEFGDTELIRLAAESPHIQGRDLVRAVTQDKPYSWSQGTNDAEPRTDAPRFRVACIDCGIKHNILRLLVDHRCAPTIFGPNATAEEILASGFDGLFVGNGPGDPAAVTATIATLRNLIGKLPVFGICLGHQLLALALGAETYKLKFGHHGTNHPVRNLGTGKVEITSQNHGFATDADSLGRCGARITHINLNDGSVEVFRHTELPLFAVQYHPEAAPGPHDARYLFTEFAQMLSRQTH
jgi:carbamoyl-phosphate synthase small subunit